MSVQPVLGFNSPLADLLVAAPLEGVQEDAVGLPQIASSVMPGAFPHTAWLQRDSRSLSARRRGYRSAYAGRPPTTRTTLSLSQNLSLIHI